MGARASHAGSQHRSSWHHAHAGAAPAPQTCIPTYTWLVMNIKQQWRQGTDLTLKMELRLPMVLVNRPVTARGDSEARAVILEASPCSSAPLRVELEPVVLKVRRVVRFMRGRKEPRELSISALLLPKAPRVVVVVRREVRFWAEAVRFSSLEPRVVLDRKEPRGPCACMGAWWGAGVGRGALGPGPQRTSNVADVQPLGPWARTHPSGPGESGLCDERQSHDCSAKGADDCLRGPHCCCCCALRVFGVGGGALLAPVLSLSCELPCGGSS